MQLIHNSPLTKLSDEVQTKLVNKMKDSFTEHQQQLFVASFYNYLNKPILLLTWMMYGMWIIKLHYCNLRSAKMKEDLIKKLF